MIEAPRQGSAEPDQGRARAASDRIRQAMPLSGAGAVAVGIFALALILYVRTLLPGPSFGDWAEMQLILARLGVPHPTGYPLYMLLGKAFSLLPVGSQAWRADLLSAVAAAGAAGTSVLISTRLGVRPSIAAILGLSLAATGTLWLEATFSEMNSLHLLLMALVIHRALVWRAERRDTDLLLGALLAGLSVANHLLAVTVIPIVTVFVLFDARRRLRERPILLAQAALLFLIGPALYLVIPIRALFGPAEVYGSLLTWDGLSGLISGAQFRSDMHFGTAESVATAWRAIPGVVAQLQDRSNIAFVYGGLVGVAILLIRDRWAGALLALIAMANVYVYAGYLGDLEHYLLVSWLVLTVGLAFAAETLVARLGAWRGAGAVAQLILLLLPLSIVAGNWSSHDQSANQAGQAFAETVFAALPRDAVLLTYWDALTNLSYVHCVEGERPDLSLRAYDPAARVTCDPLEDPLEDVVTRRPVFALFAFDSDLDPLRGSFDLVPGPLLDLPYGRRLPDRTGVLYRLEPKGLSTGPSDDPVRRPRDGPRSVRAVGRPGVS